MTKSDSSEIPAAPPAQEPQSEAAPPAPPKSQLARRVAARLAALEACLEKLGDEPMHQKRRAAIIAAIKGAHSSMNLNAERMSPMEAGVAARWLETSEYLTIGNP